MKLYGRKDTPMTDVPDHTRQANDGMYEDFRNLQMPSKRKDE